MAAFCPMKLVWQKHEYFDHQSMQLKEPSEICTVWGVWLWKKFCKMFSESSPCLLGQHGTCSTVQQPVELSENILQNIFHNRTPQTVRSAIRYVSNRDTAQESPLDLIPQF